MCERESPSSRVCICERQCVCERASESVYVSERVSGWGGV